VLRWVMRGDTAVRIEAMASWAGTIPHEILTSINTRVPRVYSNRLPGGTYRSFVWPRVALPAHPPLVTHPIAE
jgi:hypothetical protein